MGTLKTTLKVESTDLFPAPVSFTKINNYSIYPGISSFTSFSIHNDPVFALPTKIIDIPAFNSFTSESTVFYISAPLTNDAPISLLIRTDNPTSISLAMGPPYPTFPSPYQDTFYIADGSALSSGGVTTTGGGDISSLSLGFFFDSTGAIAMSANPPYAGYLGVTCPGLSQSTGFLPGDIINIPGTFFGGSTPADDLSLYVAYVQEIAFATIYPGDTGMFELGNNAYSFSLWGQPLNFPSTKTDVQYYIGTR